MKAKSTIIIVFVTSLLTSSLLAQNPIFEWAKHMGGINEEYLESGRSITTDTNGNVYTMGVFSDIVDFDPGPGITNLTSVGLHDFFIQKLDANGNFLWVKQIGGVNEEYGGSMTTDTNGNVYTTGSFQEIVDFDPGVGTVNLTSFGGQDIFIQKLDAYGNFIWVKQMGGIGVDTGYSITIDDIGNVYTTGRFSDIVDFDPGTGINILTAVEGSHDIFIQKLDTNGNFIWAKQMGGNSIDNGNSITTDTNGNLYTTGYFQLTVDFDPGTGTANLTSLGISDIFIQKLDANGNFQWAKHMGGTGIDSGSSITTDINGNVFTIGNFYDTVDFDPGAGITYLTSIGSVDSFIQKLDTNGNFLWVNQIGGNSEDYGESITTDANGSIYTTGNFRNIVDFDPGVGTANLTSLGSNDIFIQKLNTSGNLLWVVQIGGGYSDGGISITTDTNGNVYTTGSFSGTVDFDPGIGITNFTSLGFSDIFIQKLYQTPLGLLENSFADNYVLYPNPTDGKFSINFENTQESLTVRLLSILGQEIQIKKFQNTNYLQLELKQPNGIYVLEITNYKGEKAVYKLIKK